MRYPILGLILIGNRPRILNCWSSLRDFEVKIDIFQIKQNVLNLKWTLAKYFRKIFQQLFANQANYIAISMDLQLTSKQGLFFIYFYEKTFSQKPYQGPLM